MRFIPTHALQPGMIVARDIISRKNAAMLKKGMVISLDHITYLMGHGYMGVYISDSVSDDIHIEETISKETFTEGLEAVADGNIDKMVNVSASIVKEVMSRDSVTVDLLDLRSFDDYTYHHSVNVAVYATVVGRKMGLTEAEIDILSQASICHDLGKMRIPEKILNKPGKLTDAEYKIIKSHPQKSVEILEKNPEISAVVKQAVLLHHENENGSGYPKHKLGSELPLIVKILHAVDVYDALTSKRPYKEPYSPAEAFEYLKGGCDILFNREVVEAMMEAIPAYPPGIDVTLSDGREGIVIEHTVDAMRPRIKVFVDGRIIDLSAPENAGLRIVSCGLMTFDLVSGVESLNEDRNKARAVKKKVMVVDDMVMSAKQTVIALGDDYEIITCLTGLEAMNYVSAHGCPDLLVVDIEMPNINGFALVKSIKNKGFTDVPVIFLTGRADKETVLKCIKLGAKDYIVKPALPVYLRERVAKALGISAEREF